MDFPLSPTASDTLEVMHVAFKKSREQLFSDAVEAFRELSYQARLKREIFAITSGPAPREPVYVNPRTAYVAGEITDVVPVTQQDLETIATIASDTEANERQIDEADNVLSYRAIGEAAIRTYAQMLLVSRDEGEIYVRDGETLHNVYVAGASPQPFFQIHTQ